LGFNFLGFLGFGKKAKHGWFCDFYDFQLVDSYEFLFVTHNQNIPIFANLYVYMFQKFSRDKIFCY